MVQAILFDFWGTLAEAGVWSPVKQVKNILGVKLPFSEYVIKMEKVLMTQKFTDLREAFTKVCNEFNVEPTEEVLEELIGVWNKSWMLAAPYEEVVETLQKLRENYQIILVSNTDCFAINKVLEKFGLTTLFDKMFFSYDLGMLKTDRGFFLKVMSEMNLNVNDCVMVGDSIQSDIMAAKALGMKAILIDRKNTREFHPKIKSLREVEKIIEH